MRYDSIVATYRIYQQMLWGSLSLALAHTNDGWYRTSGHVGQFTDYAVKDTVTGSCFRADHLVAGMLMPHTNMPPHARL